MKPFELSFYLGRFDDVLSEKYNGQTFHNGFSALRERYKDLRAGSRRVNVDDVMAIFDDELPFVQDWTKPDRDRLEKRMRTHHVGDAIHRLRGQMDTQGAELLIGQIRQGFGDLSLTALVLHHAHPTKYAMCSHHLASLLHIVNVSTLPKFYMRYCAELEMWGRASTTQKLNVAEAELALWTWYRLAHYGRKEERKKHRDAFYNDPWVQERRAKQIAESLNGLGRIDLARSYIGLDPNVAAIIAWVEFESFARDLMGKGRPDSGARVSVRDLVNQLPAEAIPRSRDELLRLWYRNRRGRNEVVHSGLQLERNEAKAVVDGVMEFLAHNAPD